MVLCGRGPEAAEQAARELQATAGGEIAGTAADVRNRDEVRALFEFTDRTFGAPDILINNAGIGVFSPVADLSLEDWHRVIDTNLTGVFHCCQEALARFKKKGGGFIINISSLAAKNPFAGGGVYNASKFGLNGFTEAMMLDHRHDHVRVSTIMPGSVETGFSPRSSGAKADWKIAPEDIADIVIGVLRMPERTLISSVEVRPSRPPK